MPGTSEFSRAWTSFWMRWSGLNRVGRWATRMAAWTAPPYLERHHLAMLTPKGFISPSAILYHNDLRLGCHVLLNDDVMIYRDTDGGPVRLGDRVRLFEGTCLETGYGGSIEIGDDTHVHPRCFVSAYQASVRIGHNVLISGQCAFYPYDHGFDADRPILDQPIQTKGDIVIDDGAWLGYGVFVTSGVRIGKGAVIGARSVVTKSVPDGAVAAGVPARIIKMRTAFKDSAGLPPVGKHRGQSGIGTNTHE